MALINCPECGKEISDKSVQCLYCGFPLGKNSENEENNINMVKICGIDYDLTKVRELLDKKQRIKAVRLLREITGIGLTDANIVIDSLERNVDSNEKSKVKYSKVLVDTNVSLVACKVCGKQISNQAPTCIHCGQPTGIRVCPKCGWPETKVISNSSKAAASLFGGIFATQKIINKYECKKCKHRF